MECFQEIGCRRDAIYAGLDLLTVGYEAQARGPMLQSARAVIATLLDSPETPDHVKAEVRRYLEHPTHPSARAIRTAIVDQQGHPLQRLQRPVRAVDSAHH